MAQSYLEGAIVQNWLHQFTEGPDRSNAAKLFSLIRLISSNKFRRGLMDKLHERLIIDTNFVAFYNETERKTYNGKPNRLFKEKKSANKKKKGHKICRAYGYGPPLVSRQRYINEEIGSEGIIANILTSFYRENRDRVLLNPGPDLIREKFVRRFILVTDFIGSGDRVIAYLNSAWRISSVRSWWSRRGTRGMRFEVIAYSGTDMGIERVKKHPSRPEIYLIADCPTIKKVFPETTSNIMYELCRKYAPKGTKPLGYGDTGVLLAFDHGIPNNAPAMLWEKTKKWSALFPKRSTLSAQSPLIEEISEEDEKKRIEIAATESYRGPKLEPTNLETIILSALRRSPHNANAVSGRLGLDISTVINTMNTLKSWGWINSYNKLTERGRLVAKRLAAQYKKNPLSTNVNKMYFPSALRAPRDI